MQDAGNRREDMDVEFMTRCEAKAEIRKLRVELRDVKAVVQTWLDKQGHNRCHYYPELFRELADKLGLEATVDPELPPIEEFRAECKRFAEEEYRCRLSEDSTGSCCETGVFASARGAIWAAVSRFRGLFSIRTEVTEQSTTRK